MNILHITGHLGGGIGSTLLSWVELNRRHKFWIHSLDYINSHAADRMNCAKHCMYSTGNLSDAQWNSLYKWSDVVLVHWWPNLFLDSWISKTMPPGRVIFWGHNNYNIPVDVIKYADKFITTSRVMGFHLPCIKSTGNIEKFLDIKPSTHDGYNVGYVGTVNYKKIHSKFLSMCREINSRIPGSNFIVAGEYQLKYEDLSQPQFDMFTFLGKISNPELQYAIIDVFGYPLRRNHYGTSELVIGEAMASGIPVVTMNNPAEMLIVQEGVTGYLSSSEDDYVDNIEHLFHKPVLRRWMGENARESAKELYNIKQMISSWNDEFDMAMGNPKHVRNPVQAERNDDEE